MYDFWYPISMALEGTHIRFALDFKEKMSVQNLKHYVSGSIYPDSRYVTGIDRLATHPAEYKTDPMFHTSDFHKGWFMHLLCDELQGTAIRETLPDAYAGEGKESWIKRTAIKILQDIDDAKQFELAAYLPALAYIENPNGEDIEKLRTYNAIFRKMYVDPGNVTIDIACDVMWSNFSIGEDLVELVRAQSKKYEADTDKMTHILRLYERMRALAETVNFG